MQKQKGMKTTMLTEEQIFLNIFEVEIHNRNYKYYKYSLNGNETFTKHDMDLYGIDGLLIDGEEEEGLDLIKLEEFDHIRALDLCQRWYTSVNTLQTFCEIEHFRVLDLCDSAIPFDQFQKQYSTEVNYHPKTCQLLFDNSSIEFLRLHNYKEKSPESLIKLETLKELALEQCKIEDLDFLVQLLRLKSLRVSYNRNLKSIEGVVKNKNIRGLEIRNCRNIEDWDALSGASQLVHLVLEDCGEIDSLSFLNKLPNLKVLRLIGNTKVIDGQLKSILENENLEFMSLPICKHYDLTLDDLRQFTFKYIHRPDAIHLYQPD